MVFTPSPQYIPRGLKGVIRCEVDANPPVNYITWIKDNRIFNTFEKEGVSALKNGSILIDYVTDAHAGDYQCHPFNKRGSSGPSPIIVVQIRDPPTLMTRPDTEYVRNIGSSVSFTCMAVGNPKPDISWRRVIKDTNYTFLTVVLILVLLSRSTERNCPSGGQSSREER